MDKSSLKKPDNKKLETESLTVLSTSHKTFRNYTYCTCGSTNNLNEKHDVPRDDLREFFVSILVFHSSQQKITE